MQKGGMLNSSIAKVLADLGHTDTIVIGDCGLPVPAGVQKIDLALKPGTPSFLEVVEMEGRNPAVYGAMKQLFTEEQWIIDADHEAFKEATKHAKCIIRTGEITPYANVILHSNVFF